MKTKNRENQIIGIIQSLEDGLLTARPIDSQDKNPNATVKIIKLYFSICFAIFVLSEARSHKYEHPAAILCIKLRS